MEYTSDDLTALHQLESSRGWLVLKHHLEVSLGLKRAQLERVQDHPSLCRLQGSVESFRLAIDLPQIVRNEIKLHLDKSSKRS